MDAKGQSKECSHLGLGWLIESMNQELLGEYGDASIPGVRFEAMWAPGSCLSILFQDGARTISLSAPSLSFPSNY